MQLIIIHGATSTGKTTLAQRLAADTGITAVLKDAYKEEIFDTLPKPPNLVLWKKIELASWRNIYDHVRRAQANNEPIIIEGNFMGPQRRTVAKLVGSNDTIKEIYCYADRGVVQNRYRERYRSGARHKGHRDHLWYGKLLLDGVLDKIGLGNARPLKLSHRLLTVDTTDFSKVNYDRILAFVRAT
ncbi:MAG TPA: AAA family ATPase [Candidatus Saccharimonadales bacterium]|nr:AAA family ATPase [Candidatus Saccharimonadales bacterium]